MKGETQTNNREGGEVKNSRTCAFLNHMTKFVKFRRLARFTEVVNWRTSCVSRLVYIYRYVLKRALVEPS